jgi:hypothetical protein
VSADQKRRFHVYLMELYFSTEQCTAKNPDVIKHPLANLNAKIVIILVTSLHSLQMEMIQILSYMICHTPSANSSSRIVIGS